MQGDVAIGKSQSVNEAFSREVTTKPCFNTHFHRISSRFVQVVLYLLLNLEKSPYPQFDPARALMLKWNSLCNGPLSLAPQTSQPCVIFKVTTVSLSWFVAAVIAFSLCFLVETVQCLLEWTLLFGDRHVGSCSINLTWHYFDYKSILFCFRSKIGNIYMTNFFIYIEN